MRGATILQVVPELDVGGAETTTLEIAAGICRAGGRALVASEGGRLEAEIEKAGAEIIHLPVASKNLMTVYGNIGRLAKLIKSEKVNIIHARSRARPGRHYLPRGAAISPIWRPIIRWCMTGQG